MSRGDIKGSNQTWLYRRESCCSQYGLLWTAAIHFHIKGEVWGWYSRKHRTMWVLWGEVQGEEIGKGV